MFCANNLVELPDDSEALKAILRSLLLERDQDKERAREQQQRADDLYLENLRLQVELDRLKKWYYGPRADRLQSEGDLAQLLLSFAEAMDRKPVNPADLPPHAEPEQELRRVNRRKGRRRVQDFANLPVTTHLHELSTEERICPCCGIERQEIGHEDSWQIEYFPGHLEPGSPRTGLRPWGGSASIMCARNTPARPARPTATTRASRQRPSRRRPSKRDWPDRVC